MGIESVSYWYKPDDCGMDALSEWLLGQGARTGAKPATFVMSGSDHWFDLLVRPSGMTVGVVQVRVALTNPRSALQRLRALLSELLHLWGGTVTDVAGDRVFDELDEACDDFMLGFLTRQAEFIEQFGQHVLAVSADEVFDRIRGRPEL